MWPFSSKKPTGAEMEAKVKTYPATVIVGGRKMRNVSGERLENMKRRRDALGTTLARINIENPRFKQTARYRLYVDEYNELQTILDGMGA